MEWDYAALGWYFITIWTNARIPFFGEIEDGDVRRSPLGNIALQCWIEIPHHFSEASLDAFVIMPNRVATVEMQHAASLLARFIQADTIVPGADNSQSYDRYAYTNNNPIKYTDPTGQRNYEEDGYENSQDNSSTNILSVSITTTPEFTITPSNIAHSNYSTPTPINYRTTKKSITDISIVTPINKLTSTPNPASDQVSQLNPVVQPLPIAPNTPANDQTSCVRNEINVTNMVFDMGSIALDVGTVGIGGRGAKAANFGYSNLEIGKDLFSLDFGNKNLDWYDYASTGLDVVGLVWPIVRAAFGITINIVHAVQCK